MASSFTMRNFGFGDGLTYASQDVRLAIAALVSSLGGASGNALSVGGGVHPATSNPLGVAASSGLSVTVNVGYATIPSASANGGAYTTILDSPATLTCVTASTVFSRIDSVCITVADGGTSSSTVVVQIVTGTPGASPVAPTLAADSLLLCNITVPANATTLTSGNLADQRTYMAGAGGITHVQSAAFYPTVGAVGDVLYDMNLARYRMWTGSAWRGLSTVAFAPVSNGPNTQSATGTLETVSSVSVTVDGATSVRVTFTFDSVTNAGTSAGNACTVGIARGSTGLKNITKTCWGPDSPLDGGTIVITDINPAAGTYAYEGTIVNQGAGTYAVHNGIIYVEALPS